MLLLKYLMEFNSTPGDLMELSPSTAHLRRQGRWGRGGCGRRASGDRRASSVGGCRPQPGSRCRDDGRREGRPVVERSRPDAQGRRGGWGVDRGVGGAVDAGGERWETVKCRASVDADRSRAVYAGAAGGGRGVPRWSAAGQTRRGDGVDGASAGALGAQWMQARASGDRQARGGCARAAAVGGAVDADRTGSRRRGGGWMGGRGGLRGLRV